VPSTVLHKDLGIPTIREEIKNSSKKYKDRLQTHPNDLATNLFDDEDERTVTSKQGNNKEQEHTRNKVTNEHD
jgi:hypothetical protein